MLYLRNIVYVVLVVLALPLLLWRSVMHGKYRDGWREKFLGDVPKLDEPRGVRLWFHAVSVGEVMLLRPLLALIHCRHPEWECVVSTTSQAGMELAQRLFRDDHTVFYCPLDFSWSVRRAVERIAPTILVLAEQELWPNLVALAKRHGASVAIINGRFSSAGFKRYRFARIVFRSMMQQLDAVAAQSVTYANCFAALGTKPDRIHVTGSMKFDGAQTDRHNAASEQLRKLASITDDDVVFLAGSTQNPEESLAVDVYESLVEKFPQLRLIVVPRHPQRFDEVAAMLESRLAPRGVAWQRRSAIDNTVLGKAALDKTPQCNTIPPRILLVDTVGELGAWWGTADIAFVGGSLHKRGGQNMIEPAAYGAAVCFGPNTSNFRDIVAMMLESDAAVVVHDGFEMETFVRRCLEDVAMRKSLGLRAQKLAQQQRGATEKTLAMLETLL
ncbi:MAG: 3-deoxy-D-manno-octulosonic acid transferase [Thermoguttaceae bacterium]